MKISLFQLHAPLELTYEATQSSAQMLTSGHVNICMTNLRLCKVFTLQRVSVGPSSTLTYLGKGQRKSDLKLNATITIAPAEIQFNSNQCNNFLKKCKVLMRKIIKWGSDFRDSHANFFFNAPHYQNACKVRKILKSYHLHLQ